MKFKIGDKVKFSKDNMYIFNNYYKDTINRFTIINALQIGYNNVYILDKMPLEKNNWIESRFELSYGPKLKRKLV